MIILGGFPPFLVLWCCLKENKSIFQVSPSLLDIACTASVKKPALPVLQPVQPQYIYPNINFHSLPKWPTPSSLETALAAAP